MPRRLLALLLVTAPLALVTGCTGQARGTTTARGSTETLLLSTSAGRAIRAVDAKPWKGKRGWIDESRLDCYDKNYVVSSLRVRLARAGVILVDGRGDAELVFEPRAGTFATWEGNYAFGVPPLPISYGGTAILTPEITLGIDVQQGWAKFQVFAYERESGAFAGEAEVWGMASEDLLRSVYPSIVEVAKEEVDKRTGGDEDGEKKQGGGEEDSPRKGE